MNRNGKEIKEDIANNYITRSMMAYPSDKSILPLILHLNISSLNNANSIQLYDDQIIKCRLCGSFFNPYCQINENSVNWKCSVCNSINQLPLPPSDSIFTAYSIAKKSICYNNSVFDYAPPHFPIKNHQKPKIIISIQSSIYNDIKNTLLQIPEENDFFSYCITVFDFSLQLFNFHSKAWHIISDFGEDGNFFFPTKQENLFSNFSNIHNVFLTSNDFPSDDHCNLENVYKFVNNFQNAKLVLILSGPVISSIPKASFPVSIIFYKKANFMQASKNFCQVLNNPSSEFFIMDYADKNSHILIDYQEKLFIELINFLSRSFFSPFKSNISIRLNAPKLFEICQDKNDYHLYTVSRRQSSVAQILSFIQFEISYNDCMNDGILTYRYINTRIPLSPDPRIFRSATFPNPLIHLSVVAYYMITKLLEIFLFEKEIIFLKITNKMMEIGLQFPLMSFYLPHFVHELISSDIMKNLMNSDERNLILLNLKNMPPQITLLHFLPLQLVNGKLMPLYPKENNDAVARVTEKVILILKSQNSIEISQSIYKQLKVDEIMLPFLEVDSFEKVRDDESSFNQWKHDFELSSYKFLEEKKAKRK